MCDQELADGNKMLDQRRYTRNNPSMDNTMTEETAQNRSVSHMKTRASPLLHGGGGTVSIEARWISLHIRSRAVL